MDIKDLRHKSSDELRTVAADLRVQLVQARLAVAQRQVKKISEQRRLRRDLARVLTLLGQNSKRVIATV